MTTHTAYTRPPLAVRVLTALAGFAAAATACAAVFVGAMWVLV